MTTWLGLGGEHRAEVAVGAAEERRPRGGQGSQGDRCVLGEVAVDRGPVDQDQLATGVRVSSADGHQQVRGFGEAGAVGVWRQRRPGEPRESRSAGCLVLDHGDVAGRAVRRDTTVAPRTRTGMSRPLGPPSASSSRNPSLHETGSTPSCAVDAARGCGAQGTTSSFDWSLSAPRYGGAVH